ncbi:MAG: hypothetical protein A2Z88_03860 [Omnitrophica WOR_2 bacterium GWA2_47_8]|nr:MAG: hypothetical protein A2Z88_03860 [Omnitrophica WOR_2 bacterium GWA2_47_8]
MKWNPAEAINQIKTTMILRKKLTRQDLLMDTFNHPYKILQLFHFPWAPLGHLILKEIVAFLQPTINKYISRA